MHTSFGRHWSTIKDHNWLDAELPKLVHLLEAELDVLVRRPIHKEIFTTGCNALMKPDLEVTSSKYLHLFCGPCIPRDSYLAGLA